MVFENIPTWQIVLLIVLLFAFFVSGIIVVCVIIYRRKWNYSVTILENTPPFGYIPTKNDRARLISFGDSGEEIYFLRGLKKYRIGYGKKIGKNKIAWAIGDDGYWYNTTFGDLNKKLLQIGIVPVERDMRFANATLRKGIEKRYDDRSFIEKWGVPITISMLIVAILVQAGGVYWNIREANKGKAAEKEISTAQLETMKLAKDTLLAVSNIKDKTGGSGLTSVP